MHASLAISYLNFKKTRVRSNTVGMRAAVLFPGSARGMVQDRNIVAFPIEVRLTHCQLPEEKDNFRSISALL